MPDELFRTHYPSVQGRGCVFIVIKAMFIHYTLCEYSVACIVVGCCAVWKHQRRCAWRGKCLFYNTHILAPTLRRSCHPSPILFISSSASMLDGTNVHICIRININFNCQVLVPRVPGCCAVWKHQEREGRGKHFWIWYIFLRPRGIAPACSDACRRPVYVYV